MQDKDIRWYEGYMRTIKDTLENLTDVYINGEPATKEVVERIDNETFDLWFNDEATEKVL